MEIPIKMDDLGDTIIFGNTHLLANTLGSSKKRICTAEMRRPRCPKSAAIASKTSAEAKPLPSVNGPPRPTFETGAANGLKGKLFGYPDIPKVLERTMRSNH